MGIAMILLMGTANGIAHVYCTWVLHGDCSHCLSVAPVYYIALLMGIVWTLLRGTAWSCSWTLPFDFSCVLHWISPADCLCDTMAIATVVLYCLAIAHGYYMGIAEASHMGAAWGLHTCTACGSLMGITRVLLMALPVAEFASISTG